jgi:hypothetical protein
VERKRERDERRAERGGGIIDRNVSLLCSPINAISP